MPPYSEHFGVNTTGEVYLAQSVYGFPRVRYTVSMVVLSVLLDRLLYIHNFISKKRFYSSDYILCLQL